MYCKKWGGTASPRLAYIILKGYGVGHPTAEGQGAGPSHILFNIVVQVVHQMGRAIYYNSPYPPTPQPRRAGGCGGRGRAATPCTCKSRT